MSHNGSAAWAV